MNRVVIALLLLASAACGKSTSRTSASPGTTTPAAQPATAAHGFTLGEATVTALLDKRLQPVSRPVWKLHADGTSEHASDSGEWKPALEARPDGTIWVQGQKVASVTDTAITYAIPDGPPPIVIDGNTLSLVIWQKAHDGEDFTAKIELASDGTVTVHHRDGVRNQWKIEAADPAVMLTAFHIFALSMKMTLD